MRKQLWKKDGEGKSPDGSACTFIAQIIVFLSVYANDRKMAGKTQNMPKMCAKLQKRVDLDDPVSFTDEVHFGCTQRAARVKNGIVTEKEKIVLEADQHKNKVQNTSQLGATTWKVMLGSALNAVANCPARRLPNKVSTSCLDGHHLRPEDLEIVAEFPETWSQVQLTCLYSARIGRPDLLWTVDNLAGSVTKWNGAWCLRLARLISYIHHTTNYKHYCHVGNQAMDCKLELVQDADFAGKVTDSSQHLVSFCNSVTSMRFEVFKEIYWEHWTVEIKVNLNSIQGVCVDGSVATSTSSAHLENSSGSIQFFHSDDFFTKLEVQKLRRQSLDQEERSRGNYCWQVASTSIF